ncbi:hypothetical protein Tco_1236660 [Tanacetum coccineum]
MEETPNIFQTSRSHRPANENEQTTKDIRVTSSALVSFLILELGECLEFFVWLPGVGIREIIRCFFLLSVTNTEIVEESKAEDEANVEDTTYPGKEDGLDSLSFMAWVKAAPITFSEDMLIRRSQSQSLCSKKPPLGVVGEKPKSEKLSKPMAQRFSPPSSGVNTVCCAALITRSRGTLLGGLHDDSQSKVFYYAIFISSKTGLGGSWDEEKKQKVQGEMSSKELVKIRFFSTGHGVKLEGSMNYTNGKSWALLLSIYKWSRQRAPLVQKAASYKHYSKSSELSNKSKASRGRIQQDYRHGMPIKSVKGSLIKAGKQEDMTELMMDRISKGERLS